MDRAELRGRRATVMGLGTRGGGLGVTRYLAEAGAIVTVTDMKPAEALQEPISALADLPVRFVLGQHDEADFRDAEIVVRNPGVRANSPLLELARQHGARVDMEMSLFLRACPAPVIGITGTKGKTTTATLIGELLRAWDPRTVVAGNMGVSALAQLPDITAETPVVLELSSWQLEALDEHRMSPHISVITMIAEDHLNTYRSFDHYAETKRSITAHQRAGDVAVLPVDDREAWSAASTTAAQVIAVGAASRAGDAVWVAGDVIHVRIGSESFSLPYPASAALAGAHQRGNVGLAVAAAAARGATPEAIARGLANFRGVRDRMEVVREIDGVRFINDTTATAPVAAAAALRAEHGRRVHLIAGGADKGLDPGPMIEAIVEVRPTVHLIDGTATARIAAELASQGIAWTGPHQSMASALAAARTDAISGDVVLLSPGCASFGVFTDEFDRGAQFRALVQQSGTGR